MFEVKVVMVNDVQEHPNADRLNLVRIGGYNCISNKLEDGSPRYQKGDLVVYIPEAAILPEYLLKRMGFWHPENQMGTLNGPNGNRVKAMKLRGIISQGVVMPVQDGLIRNADEDLAVAIGSEVSDFLGITKYEPEIPEELKGAMVGSLDMTLNFDVENHKKYPDVFVEDEPVMITEKLHGILGGIAISSTKTDLPIHHNGLVAFFSKGTGASHMVFQDNPENNTSNVYCVELMRALSQAEGWGSSLTIGSFDQMFILGEIVGVQDLKYGHDGPEKAFYVFDVAYRTNGVLTYLTPDATREFCEHWNLNMVPVLYEGPYRASVLEDLKDGKTAMCVSQIR